MWTCPKCGEKSGGDLGICWNCGTARNGTPPADPQIFEAAQKERETEEEQRKQPARKKRHFFLEAAAPLCWLGAWVALAVGAIMAIVARNNASLALVAIVGGLGYFLYLMVLAEAITVILNIENGTQEMLEYVKKKLG